MIIIRKTQPKLTNKTVLLCVIVVIQKMVTRDCRDMISLKGTGSL